MNDLLEVRLEGLRESLDKLASVVDENLRALLLRLTCDKAVAASAPFYDIEPIARQAREGCMLFLAREHPLAGDLKFAMAAVRVGYDYERLQELAAAMGKRVGRLVGTPAQGLMQDMTGVMADILKMHEVVRQSWRLNGQARSGGIKTCVSLLAGAIRQRIHRVQNTITENIARGGADAEIVVEVVLTCRHLRRIAETMEAIPDELHTFDVPAPSRP